VTWDFRLRRAQQAETVLHITIPHRRFRMWSYVPTHSGLVLRTEFEPDELHVELLFQPVEAIKLPTFMDGGLVVDVADHFTASAVLQDLNVHLSAESHVFTIRGNNFEGHVVAGYLFLGKERRTRYSPFSLFHGYLSSDFNR
jgi:hypothetical protein